MLENKIVVECVACGEKKLVFKDFFSGMEYCKKCQDLTSHFESGEKEQDVS